MGFGDDAIKIQVGIKNNVPAGMQQVVNDVNKGAGKIDKAMRGKGFAEAFGKVLRGDISGALEDMQERMGAGMQGIAAKAMVWGGGIATALIAGFKAGQKLDDMFGLSDKISGALAKFGTQLDDLAEKKMKRLRSQREQQNQNYNTEFRNVHESTQEEIDAANKGRQDYLNSLPDRAREIEKDVLSTTEARIIAQEEAEDAALDLEIDRLDRKAQAHQDEFDKITAANADALDKQKTALQASIAQRVQAVEAASGKIAALQDNAAKDREAAGAAWGMVLDRGKGRDAERAKKEQERTDKRKRFLVEQAEAARARGVRGDRIDAILNANKLQKQADKDAADLLSMQKKQAEDIAAIKNQQAKLLQMK